MRRCGSYPRRSPGRCSNQEHRGLCTFEDIVDAYARHYRPKRLKEMRFYATRPSFTEAIRVAALCLNENGKRHPHQCRIRRGLLPEAERRLQAGQEELAVCATFDELFEWICEVIGPIKGIGCGGVTPYDIATRIGAYLDREPAYIYLHNGTLKGARALGLRGRRLSRDQLPHAFRALEPAELEDCLCSFKDELLAIAASSARPWRA